MKVPVAMSITGIQMHEILTDFYYNSIGLAYSV